MPGAAVLLWQPSISRAGRIMIQYIRIQNFRSVKDIALELGPLNIVFGPNGCG
ncbi:TPA: AAA family ATPase, partial [Klebsiella pneumoniae]